MATKLISLLALAATIVPCLLYLGDMIGHETVKIAAIVGTIVWFAVTPTWMGREQKSGAEDAKT